MHVAEILKTKGTHVVTTGSEGTIAATARLLTSEKIGAVVVTESPDKVIGILSERDIIRGIAEFGAKALGMKVGDLMTSDVVTCKLEDNLNAVMAVMTTRRIRHLPVMEEGELRGIISIGDVVKYRLEEAQMEVNALRDYVLGAG